MPSSKAASPAVQVVTVALDRGDRDRAAREPRPVQQAGPVPPDQQAADAGRVADDLVERERGEVRRDPADVEPGSSARRPRRRAARPSRPGAPRRRGRGGAARRRSSTGPGRPAGCGPRRRAGRRPQRRAHRHAVDAEFGRRHRHVADPGAVPPGELADAVDRVVVVDGERERAAGREPVRLADQPQRRAGVGGEHAEVLVPRGARRNRRPPAGPARPAPVEASEVGLFECGLPRTAVAQQRGVGVDLAGRRAARRRCSRGRRGRSASRRPYSCRRSRANAPSGSNPGYRRKKAASAAAAPVSS